MYVVRNAVEKSFDEFLRIGDVYLVQADSAEVSAFAKLIAITTNEGGLEVGVLEISPPVPWAFRRDPLGEQVVHISVGPGCIGTELREFFADGLTGVNIVRLSEPYVLGSVIPAGSYESIDKGTLFRGELFEQRVHTPVGE